MTSKSLKTAVATAALLLTTALAGPAFAESWNDHNGSAYSDQSQSYGHNGDNRDGGFSDRDYGHGFNDNDFANSGRFYYHGDVRQRYERLENWTRFMARNGQLNRWQAERAFAMLREIRMQAFRGRDTGYVSPWQRVRLNRSLDHLTVFLREARHGGDWRDSRYGDHGYGDQRDNGGYHDHGNY